MRKSRSRVVSSFTIIKGAFIEETYAIFQAWDFSLSCPENLRRVRETSVIGATSQNWLRDVAKVLNRRFDTEGRDRPLVELAQAECDRAVWRPLLLWHMTRDEFLLRACGHRDDLDGGVLLQRRHARQRDSVVPRVRRAAEGRQLYAG